MFFAIKYMIYNLVFCVFLFYEFIKLSLEKMLFVNRGTNVFINDVLKKILFWHLFGSQGSAKAIYQTIFTGVSLKLSRLHRVLFLKESYSMTLSNKPALVSFEKLVFLGFHETGIWGRLPHLLEELGLDAICIVGGTNGINTAFEYLIKGTAIRVKNNEYKINGKKFFICNSDDGIVSAIQIMGFLKQNIPVFIHCDEFTFSDEIRRNLYLDSEKQKLQRNFFEYEYKGKRIALMSSSILHILRGSGAIGLPVYVHRLKDGRDKIVFGDLISISKEKDINKYGEEITKRLFDFMIINVLNNYWAWTGAQYFSEYISIMWKIQKPHQLDQAIQIEGKYKVGQLTFLIGYNRYFMLINSYPLSFIKIDKITKKIFLALKNQGQISKKLKDRLPKEKTRSILTKLYQTGVIAYDKSIMD